jgi:hypothetical protein
MSIVVLLSKWLAVEDSNVRRAQSINGADRHPMAA